jgi:hypothetical protein
MPIGAIGMGFAYISKLAFERVEAWRPVKPGVFDFGARQ